MLEGEWYCNIWINFIISDQFILPDGDSGLYTNSYLLQPSSSTTAEPV